jgi:hypothetical protein
MVKEWLFPRQKQVLEVTVQSQVVPAGPGELGNSEGQADTAGTDGNAGLLQPP